MDAPPSAAESLPALYRAILDVIADLERRGLRVDAVRIRAEATAIYSRAWDDAGRRRLTHLHARAWRLLAGVDDRRPVHRRSWRREALPRPSTR